MDDIIKKQMMNIISSFSQLPYLFVGTGISMRYSSAPSWDNLLKDIWMTLNSANEKDYDFFNRKVEHEIDNSFSSLEPEEKKYYLNPQIATVISNQFNNSFFEKFDIIESIFTDSEIEHIIKNRLDPFKYYISKKISSIDRKNENQILEEILELKKNQNKIAGVITTNYDTILESIFEDFDVLMGNESLLIANTENLFNIYKIHGSCKASNTIIITKEDYNYFEDKLKYLSAKLLTLFVEHPIIFIGYSISDVNIRKILKEISICLSNEQLDNLKNKFIFIKPAFGQEDSINLRELIFDNKRITMTEISLNNYSEFYKMLNIIQSSMPVKQIRKMQDMYCKFIASTDAANNIFVGNVNNPNISDKVGIFFGPLETISSIGFKTYSLEDIMEDILFDSKPYLVNESIIYETFSNIRRGAGKTYLPVYKYLSKLGLTISDLPANFNIIKNDNGIALNTTEKKFCIEEINVTQISDIIDVFPDHKCKQCAYIQKNFNNIEVEDLGDFLRSKFYDKEFWRQAGSQYKKIIALYDYKKYSK